MATIEFPWLDTTGLDGEFSKGKREGSGWNSHRLVVGQRCFGKLIIPKEEEVNVSERS